MIICLLFHFSYVLRFNLALGFTLLYLSLIVLIPLSATFIRASALSWPEFWSIVTTPRVLASYRLTFGASFAAALVNAVFGLLVAWVLVRYRFPGKKLVDALVDLPFALPTAVAGIALTALYAGNGWIGQFFEPLGIKIAFTPIGIFVALTFIGLPFVVRTVQPVLEDIEAELEEAAATLGATRFQTFCASYLSDRDARVDDRFCACVCACHWGVWISAFLSQATCRWFPRSRPLLNHHEA